MPRKDEVFKRCLINDIAKTNLFRKGGAFLMYVSHAFPSNHVSK